MDECPDNMNKNGTCGSGTECCFPDDGELLHAFRKHMNHHLI